MAPKTLRKIRGEIIGPPKIGELVEGTVLLKEGSSLFVDLGAQGTAIIWGKEFHNAKDILAPLKVGDKVAGKVINLENEEGYRELSPKQALLEQVLENLREKKEKGEVFEVQIRGCNKGGLLAEVTGTPAFLPASQLSPENYPKVRGESPDLIVKALQKFVGKKLKVKIIDCNLKEKKIILSQKIEGLKKQRALEGYKVGDEVEGEVAGITSFGGFVKFGKEGLEGLLRASQLPLEKGQEVGQVIKLGQKVKAKIIEIANDRIYLKLLPKQL